MAGETQKRYPTWQADQSGYFDELVTTEWESFNIRRWPAEQHREVKRLFRYCQPEVVLNVGCGVGGHDVAIADQSGVMIVQGIDYSARSVEAAEREHPHDKVIRLVSDIADVKGSYDLVVSFQVIEHVEDPAAFLAECTRLSARWVAVFTPNRERMGNRLRRLIGKPYGLEDPQHFAEYTPDEIDAMAAPLGLRRVGVCSYDMRVFLPYVGQVVPSIVGRLLARLMPSRGDRFGVVYETIHL